MIFTVKPVSTLKGRVTLPSSKSYSIRAVLIASCGGNSTIYNLSDCEDAISALSAAKDLGAKVTKIKGNAWTIQVPSNQLSLNLPSSVDVNESGTVLRFLLPLVCLYNQKVKITGRGSLKGRPNAFLIQTLRDMGMNIKGTGEKKSIPIIIQGGNLKGGRLAINGTVSSQFVSALLITAPRLNEDTYLTLTGNQLVSLDYITMTNNILRRSGVAIKQKNERTYCIKGGQRFKGLKRFDVPCDYGLAAFLMAAAALVESDVILKGNFKDDLIQADGRILDFFKKMNIVFTQTSRSIDMRGPFRLKGGNFSLKDCPDLVPVMAVLALFADGPTRLLDIAHARAKESDRISDLRNELLKAGTKIIEKDGSLIIYPQPIECYRKNCILDPHHDHRLAMAFAILGLKLGVRIKDIECTRKSYPKFVSDLRSLCKG